MNTQKLHIYFMWLLIVGCLIFRAIWPFIHSPLDYIFSDPGRHYENGLNFLNPALMGSHDPFGYQLYLHLLLTLADGNRFIINSVTATLCVLMPIGWYLFLREILSPALARLGFLIIAATPSLVAIYGLFMNETLLLTLLGFSFWLTWKSLNIETTSSFTLAALFWSLACITRVISLPMMIFCVAFLAWRHKKYLPYSLIAITILSLCSIWPMMHSYKNLNVYSPFGFSGLVNICAASGAKTVKFNTPTHGKYGFSSPSLHGAGAFEPFDKWVSERKGTFKFNITPANGSADWDKALDDAKKWADKHNFDYIDQIQDNILIFLFDESWPDSTDDKNYDVYLYINRQARWMWPALILLLSVTAIPTLLKTPRADVRFFIILTFMMMGAMAIQQSGVMEGRYRKPLEPLIITSLLLAIQTIRKPRPYNNLG